MEGEVGRERQTEKGRKWAHSLPVFALPSSCVVWEFVFARFVFLIFGYCCNLYGILSINLLPLSQPSFFCITYFKYLLYILLFSLFLSLFLSFLHSVEGSHKWKLEGSGFLVALLLCFVPTVRGLNTCNIGGYCFTERKFHHMLIYRSPCHAQPDGLDSRVCLCAWQ